MIHGDAGHSCYDDTGTIVCDVAKWILHHGPSWRELCDDG